jgi:hypothetical protein
LLRGHLADERGRRLNAIDELLINPKMTETEKVVAYAVVRAAAVAQERQPEDAPTRKLVVNQTAMACDTGVSRQTFGKTLTRWTGQEYLRKEARGTGKFTKKGNEIEETLIELPARSFTDNLALASTWQRAPNAPKQGGNGERSCPECGGTKCKRTARTVTVRTTTIACATLGCNHVYEVTTKEIKGTASTFMDEFDRAPDISTMIDLAQIRRGQASVDTPPVPKVSATPPCGYADTLGTPPPTGGGFPPRQGPGFLYRLLRGGAGTGGRNLDLSPVPAEAARRARALCGGGRHCRWGGS